LENDGVLKDINMYAKKYLS